MQLIEKTYNYTGIEKYTRLNFTEDTIGYSQNKSQVSFVLLAYGNLADSRTLVQQLLACLNFTLGSEDLFCWYKQKKLFLWTMLATQAAENHGDKWCISLYLQSEIYTSIPHWTHS